MKADNPEFNHSRPQLLKDASGAMPIEAIAPIPAIKVELAVPDRLERQDGRSSYTPFSQQIQSKFLLL